MKYKVLNNVTKQPGIYKILNIKTNALYIGSAVNLNRRGVSHFRQLNQKKHHNQKLQSVFNKYGEENFKFKVITVVHDKSKLIEREQFYLDLLKPEYNICKIAGSTLGNKGSDIFRAKRKLLQSKPVVQLDMQGNFIAEFESAKVAGIKLFNNQYSAISSTCLGKFYHVKGFRWQYKSDYDKGIELPLKSDRKSTCRFIPVIQLTLQGEFVREFNSIKQASLITKIKSIDICYVCKNKKSHNTAGGFKWVYKSDYNKLKLAA